MAITIEEIADKLGISHATVSDVLNDKWQEKGISEETKEKIVSTAGKLNYRRNTIARALVTKRTKVLGLIIPCVTYSFFSEIARSIQDTVREHGYNVLLSYSDGNLDTEIEEIEILRKHSVEGFIICPINNGDEIETFLQLQKDKIPFVLIDQCVRGLECNFVGTDDKKGAFEAVSHLIRLGHRRIAYLSGPPNGSTNQDRLQGYIDALEGNGIIFEPELVIGEGYEVEDGYRAAEKLLELHKNNMPSAIFAVTDLVAVGALQLFQKNAIKVPEDMAIIGFADIKFVSMLSVPLTTMKQPVIEIGRRAAKMLFYEIENGINSPQRIRLEAELIIRNSCGARNPGIRGYKIPEVEDIS